MNDLLLENIAKAQTIAISGHVKPDGDCVGSCIGMYLYLRKNFPEKTVQVYLEPVSDNLKVLDGMDSIDSTFTAPEAPYDLFLAMDCGSEDRLGNALPMFKAAKSVFCIDHHVTNTNYAKQSVVVPDASSTCEVLYDLLDSETIDLPIAKALYLGIVHDTGVFKYSATSEKTMRIAGALMAKGIDTSFIIDDTFYRKTALQSRLMGYAVWHAQLILDDKVAATVLHMDDMRSFGATSADTEGIIDQLRIIKGVEVAIFAREDAPNTYKFSLRSNGRVNVSAIAAAFDGGGHKLAAGCTIEGSYDDILVQISAMIMMQL